MLKAIIKSNLSDQLSSLDLFIYSTWYTIVVMLFEGIFKTQRFFAPRTSNKGYILTSWNLHNMLENILKE